MKSNSYIPQSQRKKILLIADDIRAQSGVARVAREIILNTSHVFNYVCIGGAIQHQEAGKRLDLSNDTNTLSKIEDSSVILYPVNGYGDAQLLRELIKIEKPDSILLITDPRYFEWVFSIENEIRKQIPIAYLNIWDSPLPYPDWNKVFYESCDLLMAISKQTKNINEVVLGDKKKNKVITYVPHGLNPEVFKPIDINNNEFKKFKQYVLPHNPEFVLFFNSRNIRRKQIPDTMLSFRLFLDSLPKEKADKCTLILHTEVVSEHGTDLEKLRKTLFNKYPKSILFSTSKLTDEDLNKLYNIADGQILISSNEGWGLSLTEAILSGTPIIASVQGGMQDQMNFIDENGESIEFSEDFPSNHYGTYKKCGDWVYPIFPNNMSIQGSPKTPYISDDRCNVKDVVKQISDLYNTPPQERKQNGLKGREWAINEAGFTSEKMGERVIESFNQLFKGWNKREKYELINVTEYKEESINNPLIY
jgi:glycosyltransferase involved in cell wall biosynthesis